MLKFFLFLNDCQSAVLERKFFLIYAVLILWGLLMWDGNSMLINV